MAVIALGAGIYFSFFHSKGFLKTQATIVSVEEVTDDADNSTTYLATVEYTVDGVTHTGVLDTSSPSYKAGKTITVLYDPNNPTVVHSGGFFGI